jgi:hypothetical protein
MVPHHWYELPCSIHRPREKQGNEWSCSSINCCFV